MNVRIDPALFDADEFVARQECKSLLRFIVCGSVDHGKSTLIGRLLYESGLVLSDQLEALDHESRRYGTQGKERDFALLLDGLAAEREQKITIDVGYRFFTTARRKFIVADAPGHEQYTRNMATGASTADLALLLVSAADGLTRQTRRHALIVSMLGVRHFVVVINKMDLVGWSEARFAEIESEFQAFARDLQIDSIVFVPLAARDGDNITSRSQRMPWYQGASLLEYLESVEVAPVRASAFRMPVQYVNRPDSWFRGYCGLIASGDVYPGMPIRILPSGQRTHVARIVTMDGDLAHGLASQAVTLTLSDEIDASRGDVLVGADDPAPVTDRLGARLVAIGTEALVPGRTYLLKLAAATVKARIDPGLQVINLETHRYRAAGNLAVNDIGTAVVTLDRPLAVDRYSDCRETGSFILIDPESCDTIGMGIVETIQLAEACGSGRNVTRLSELIRATDTHARSLAKAISWRATGSLDTFFIAAVITRSLTMAGGVALAEVLTKTALYYGHERVWALIQWGRPK
jgi:sulfate adenylyltransferase large subunit